MTAVATAGAAGSLPPALAPWAAELEQLPRDLALGLYPLIARLAGALGTLSAHASAPSLEPDGYDGVVRRGPYTRLLASEWLLAWELPDEFLRRAASAEHAFLQLKHGQPAGARRSLLLFDAGPHVLGGPRIVQLALLIALCRRARAAGVELGFAALQQRKAGFHPQLSPATLLQLLAARSDRVASDDDAELWLQRAGPLQRSDDLWLIGGADLGGLRPLSSWPRVVLDEALDGGEPATVNVRLQRPGKAVVQLTLALPEPQLCARLLRDPLSSAVAPVDGTRLPFDVDRPIAFAGDGRRLQVWLDDGAVASLPVPNSPRAVPGKPRTFRPLAGEHLIALGSIGRRLLALSQQSYRFYTYGCGAQLTGRATLEARVQAHFVNESAPLADEPVPPRGVLLASGQQRWFLSGAHELFQLSDAADRLQRVPATLTAAIAPGGGLLRAFVDGSDVVVAGFTTMHGAKLPTGGSVRLELPRETDRPQVLIGHAPGHARCVAVVRLFGPVAVVEWPKSRMRHYAVPSGSSLHGVIHCDGQACLLVLDAARRTPSLLGHRQERQLPRASAEIVQLTASATTPHIAYLTRAGELVVYSLAFHQVVLRVRAGAA